MDEVFTRNSKYTFFFPVNIDQFDYKLPESLIAQHPVEPRDASRLMVLHRQSGVIEHRSFKDIVDYLRPSDALVVNRTRVMNARLRGVRERTGGQVEVVLIREDEPGRWEALLRPGARLGVGARLVLEGEALIATVDNAPGHEPRYIRFTNEVNVHRTIERIGRLPLPPYIRRDPSSNDRDRYQTVYADEPGAVAAPTAGLHFTEPLLARIRAQGTAIVPILLHVGPGTFQPIRVETIEDHVMDAEYYRVEASAVQDIMQHKQTGRIIAVGTTTVRTLETLADAYADHHLEVCDYEGRTTSFIYPTYAFRLVDTLVTNFHLPKSTLLMLVCAFAGIDQTLHAYEEAVREKYRFYSYGDAMIII